MSDRDRQKTFDQQSKIRNSEFDRQNTNMTQQTNPIGRGQNFLPPNGKPRKVEINVLILQISSALVGIVLFFLVMFLGRIGLPSRIYAGIYFLLFDLCASLAGAYLSFKYWHKKTRRR